MATALVFGGMALSLAALLRLGVTRAYFGAEMGVCPPKRVDAFPYGAVPHPMALGNVLAFTGFHMVHGCAQAYPWLAPAHLAFTVTHLAQEILDLHA